MNNNDFSPSQIVQVSGAYPKVMRCEIIEPIKPGYTKVLVKDAGTSKPDPLQIGGSWSRHSNLAMDNEFVVHVSQICIATNLNKLL